MHEVDKFAVDISTVLASKALEMSPLQTERAFGRLTHYSARQADISDRLLATKNREGLRDHQRNFGANKDNFLSDLVSRPNFGLQRGQMLATGLSR